MIEFLRKRMILASDQVIIIESFQILESMSYIKYHLDLYWFNNEQISFRCSSIFRLLYTNSQCIPYNVIWQFDSISKVLCENVTK